MKRLSFATAMLLSNAGIIIPTKGYYYNTHHYIETRKPSPNYLCRAPRIAEVVDYFMEKGIICSYYWDGRDWVYRVDIGKDCQSMNFFCKDRTHAAEASITAAVAVYKKQQG